MIELKGVLENDLLGIGDSSGTGVVKGCACGGGVEEKVVFSLEYFSLLCTGLTCLVLGVSPIVDGSSL